MGRELKKKLYQISLQMRTIKSNPHTLPLPSQMIKSKSSTKPSLLASFTSKDNKEDFSTPHQEHYLFLDFSIVSKVTAVKCISIQHDHSTDCLIQEILTPTMLYFSPGTNVKIFKLAQIN